MKNKITIILFCAFVSFTKAQNSNIEKSIIGIQAGFLGTWVYNEFKLIDKIALRTELGLSSGFGDNGKIELVISPTLAIEPRIYYNINERAKKGKMIKNNNANFFALTTRYNPDWFVISSNKNNNVPSQILIVPKWGMRRSINNHFNYELGIGLGIRSYFGKKIGFNNKANEAAAELHIRIGYDF
jgi:hypothetical protein